MPFNLYEFVENCKDEGLSEREALDELERTLSERESRLIEEYENDPITQAGWRQQDMIDLRRFER